MTEDWRLDGQDERGQISSTRDLLDQKREREANKEQKQQSQDGKKRLRMNLGALQRALNMAEAAEVSEAYGGRGRGWRCGGGLCGGGTCGGTVRENVFLSFFPTLSSRPTE